MVCLSTWAGGPPSGGAGGYIYIYIYIYTCVSVALPNIFPDIFSLTFLKHVRIFLWAYAICICCLHSYIMEVVFLMCTGAQAFRLFLHRPSFRFLLFLQRWRRLSAMAQGARRPTTSAPPLVTSSGCASTATSVAPAQCQSSWRASDSRGGMDRSLRSSSKRSASFYYIPFVLLVLVKQNATDMFLDMFKCCEHWTLLFL